MLNRIVRNRTVWLLNTVWHKITSTAWCAIKPNSNYEMRDYIRYWDLMLKLKKENQMEMCA